MRLLPLLALLACSNGFDDKGGTAGASTATANPAADAMAAAYLECRDRDGRTIWGVGIDPDVATASVRAVP
mgnify:CR=1 FL=1